LAVLLVLDELVVVSVAVLLLLEGDVVDEALLLDGLVEDVSLLVVPLAPMLEVPVPLVVPDELDVLGLVLLEVLGLVLLDVLGLVLELLGVL
jgi:hypothetical protein